jgi:hypothetical protein
MHIPANTQTLIDFLTNKPELANCICLVGDHEGRGRVACRENSRISWDSPQYTFLHFRFDGCICCDLHRKKCDCIIFRFRNNERPTMFVIETKGNNPSFSEAKEQIEYCLEAMTDLLPNPKDQFRILPVLCSGRRTPFMKETSFGNQVKILGKKRPISLCLHTENINGLC